IIRCAGEVPAKDDRRIAQCADNEQDQFSAIDAKEGAHAQSLYFVGVAVWSVPFPGAAFGGGLLEDGVGCAAGVLAGFCPCAWAGSGLPSMPIGGSRCSPFWSWVLKNASRSAI